MYLKEGILMYELRCVIYDFTYIINPIRTSFLMLLFLDFLRFSIGLKIGAIAAIVLSVENEAAFETGAGDGGYQEKWDKSFEKRRFYLLYQTLQSLLSCISITLAD
jgi:hypothetical protein